MDGKTIRLAIRDGQLDDDLDSIRGAIRSRRDVLSREKFYELREGDPVRFNNHTNPKYLVGVTARVKRFLTKNVIVECDEGQYLGRFGRIIRTSVDLLDKVE